MTDNTQFLSQTSLGFPLGFILQDAGLITQYQIQVALMDQIQYSDLKLGQILALRGWIKQTTVDFFAEKLLVCYKEQSKSFLGSYLQEADLLTNDQIKTILIEQNQTMLRFGALAVLKGYLKQETVDFFIRYLFPKHRLDSPWIKEYFPYHSFNKDKSLKNNHKNIHESRLITLS